MRMMRESRNQLYQFILIRVNTVDIADTNSPSCFVLELLLTATESFAATEEATARTAEAAAEGRHEGDDDSDDCEDEPPREEARVVARSADADYGALICGRRGMHVCSLCNSESTVQSCLSNITGNDVTREIFRWYERSI